MKKYISILFLVVIGCSKHAEQARQHEVPIGKWADERKDGGMFRGNPATVRRHVFLADPLIHASRAVYFVASHTSANTPLGKWRIETSGELAKSPEGFHFSFMDYTYVNDSLDAMLALECAGKAFDSHFTSVSATQHAGGFHSMREGAPGVEFFLKNEFPNASSFSYLQFDIESKDSPQLICLGVVIWE